MRGILVKVLGISSLSLQGGEDVVIDRSISRALGKCPSIWWAVAESVCFGGELRYSRLLSSAQRHAPLRRQSRLSLQRAPVPAAVWRRGGSRLHGGRAAASLRTPAIGGKG